jgi:hypothetical protein
MKPKMKNKLRVTIGILILFSILQIGVVSIQACPSPSVIRWDPNTTATFAMDRITEILTIPLDNGMLRVTTLFWQSWDGDSSFFKRTIDGHAVGFDETGVGIVTYGLSQGKATFELIIHREDKPDLAGIFEGFYMTRFIVGDCHTYHYGIGTEGDFVGMEYYEFATCSGVSEDTFILDPYHGHRHGRRGYGYCHGNGLHNDKWVDWFEVLKVIRGDAVEDYWNEHNYEYWLDVWEEVFCICYLIPDNPDTAIFQMGMIEPGTPVPIGNSGWYTFDAVFWQSWTYNNFFFNRTVQWHAVRNSETQAGIAYGKATFEIIVYRDYAPDLEGTFEGCYFTRFYSWTEYDTYQHGFGTEGDFVGMKYYCEVTHIEVIEEFITDPLGRL